MKHPKANSNSNSAFSRLELLMVVFILIVGFSFFYPTGRRAGSKKAQITQCASNLKQIATAMHLFSGEAGMFPMQVSTNQGGTLELCRPPISPDLSALLTYQSLSNQIRNPNILTCPASGTVSGRFWTNLAITNLDYFISADAQLGKNASILAGENHLRVNHSEISLFPHLDPNQQHSWTSARHKMYGILLLVDGSTKSLNSENLQQFIVTKSANIR